MLVTTTSSIGDSSIKRGASELSKPCVAKTYILYAPRSFNTSAAATNDATSSIKSSCVSNRREIELDFFHSDNSNQWQPTTIIAIRPPTSPTTFIGGFSLAG